VAALEMPPAPAATVGEGVTVQSDGVVLADSVTRLGSLAAGKIVVSGSHGGVYAAYITAQAGARGVVFNDAAVGRDAAGIAGLHYLDALGLPGVAVSYRSAAIGDAGDTLENGILSFVNRSALRLGCRAGQLARAGVECLAEARVLSIAPPPCGESRTQVIERMQPPRVWALDSVSLVEDTDAADVLLTGSHGALLGGRPETALKKQALAVVYNDAGGGPDGRGRTRLNALQARGIAAATVYAASARIGDGRSTYNDGRLSAFNETAASLGAQLGMTTKHFVARIVDRAGSR
jgi:hypothetical protein